ncbi:MAG: NADH-quinone oxidoreductase subunit C [Syntrophobacteraceae bacterium]|nr:NADH-quinone oxidoreductase subunit C [Desulfobacteraceae bacterium]
MENIRQIAKSDIVNEGKKLMDAGSKLVTAVCSDLDEKLEVSYFFSSGRGVDMTCLRYTVGKDEEVQSLSGVTLSSVLIENEMQELFGLKVKGLAIDYGGHMLLAHDSPVMPMLKTKKAEAKGDN